MVLISTQRESCNKKKKSDDFALRSLVILKPVRTKSDTSVGVHVYSGMTPSVTYALYQS